MNDKFSLYQTDGLWGIIENTSNEKQTSIKSYFGSDLIIKRLNEQDQQIDRLKQQLAEKDKEIERLKNLFKLNNEVVINQGKEIFDLRVQVLQQKQNQIQLAITELEKVKNKCNGMYELWLYSNHKENMYNNEDIAGVFEDISVFTNDLIKKLKGEKE